MGKYAQDLNAIQGLKTNFAKNFFAIDPLPKIVYQIGGTCGLYALDRALEIQGISHPQPRKRIEGPTANDSVSVKDLGPAARTALAGSIPTTSMRQIAKLKGISKAGEILSAKDLLALSVLCGAKNPTIEQIPSETVLWDTVYKAVSNKRTVIVPFNCDDEFDPILNAPDAVAHWSVLFGGYSNGSNRFLLTTQVGRYDVIPVEVLWRSNSSLTTWKAAKYFKFELHELNAAGTIKRWVNIFEENDAQGKQNMLDQQQMNKSDPKTYPVFKLYPNPITFTDIDIGTSMRHFCVVV
jgi:hypothetical protein